MMGGLVWLVKNGDMMGISWDIPNQHYDSWPSKLPWSVFVVLKTESFIL